MALFLIGRFMGPVDQGAHLAAAVAWPGNDVEQHAVRHLKLRRQRLRLGRNKFIEGFLGPHQEPFFRGAFPDHFTHLLGIMAGLGLKAAIFNNVLRRLHDDQAFGVETLATGAATDLTEIANAQQDGFLTVVFA